MTTKRIEKDERECVFCGFRWFPLSGDEPCPYHDRFHIAKPEAMGPLTAYDQSARDAGCSCKRNMPYMEFSFASMQEADGGLYVKHDDYAKLETELRDTKGFLDRLMEAKQRLDKKEIDDGDFCGFAEEIASDAEERLGKR